MIKKILIGFSALMFLAVILICRPVPRVTEDKALTEKGTVSAIHEAGEKDVIFHLANTNHVFYINRGLESGLELDELREKLIGKEVTFKYPKYWTPLDWNGQTKHVSKVEINGEVIFNELKKS